MGLAGKFRRLVWRLRFERIERPRLERICLENVQGHPILVLPGVFHPRIFKTSEFLLSRLPAEVPEPVPRLLDLGSGSGVGAVVAARFARRVVAVDCNPEAVRCTRINILLNHLEDRVEVREGDLFEGLGEERFDLILFNPPYLPGAADSPAERAFRNEGVASRFAARLESHLSPAGKALVVLSSNGLLDEFLDSFRRNRLDVELVCEKNLYSEVLKVYRLSRPSRAGLEQLEPVPGPGR